LANMPGRLPDYIAPPPPANDDEEPTLPPVLEPGVLTQESQPLPFMGPSAPTPTYGDITSTIQRNVNSGGPNPLALLGGLPGAAGFLGQGAGNALMRAMVNPPEESLIRGPKGEDWRDPREKAISAASEVPILGNLQNLARNYSYGPGRQSSYQEMFQPPPNEPFLDLSPMWDKSKEGQSMGFVPRAAQVLMNVAPPVAFIPTIVNAKTPGIVKLGASILGQDIQYADVLPRKVTIPEGFDRYGISSIPGKPSIINQPAETIAKAAMPGEAPIGFPFNWGSKWDELPEAGRDAYRKFQDPQYPLSDKRLKSMWDDRSAENRQALGKVFEERGLVDIPADVPPVSPDIRNRQGFSRTPENINNTVWYHGTGTPGLSANSLDPMMTKEDNLFGHGIYMTNDPEIAASYANTRGKRSGTPTTYQAKVNVGKVLDMEEPISQEVGDVIWGSLKYFKDDLPNGGADIQALINSGARVEEVWHQLSQDLSYYSKDMGIPSYEISEYLQDLSEGLRDLGYDALAHTGGLRSNRRNGKPQKLHQVLIMLNPNDAGWSRPEGPLRPGLVTSFDEYRPGQRPSGLPEPGQFGGNGNPPPGGPPRPPVPPEIPAQEPPAPNRASGSMKGGTPESRAAFKKTLEDQGYTAREDGDTLTWEASGGGVPPRPPGDTPAPSPQDPFNFPPLGGSKSTLADTLLRRDSGLAGAGRAIGSSWQDNLGLIESQAQSVGNEVSERLLSAFKPEPNGLVKSVTTTQFPDGMTIQDIAARLPEVADQLTPEQRAALKYVQDRLKPYEDTLRGTGFTRTRNDIQDGGFYLPRGKGELLEPDTEPVNPYRMPGVRGGGKSSQKPTRFDSQSEAIAKGYEYAPLNEALTNYIKDTGTTYNDKRIADYLKGLTGEDGKPMFSSAKDRISASAREAIDKLRNSQASKRATLLRNQGRVKGAEKNTDRLNKLADEAEERANKAATDFAKRMENVDSTDEQLKIAGQEADALEREAQQWAEAARKAGLSEDAIRQHLDESKASYNEVREQLRDLMPSWDHEKRQAQQLPRGTSEVALNSTRGLAGPTEYVNEINKAIDQMAPSSGFGSRLLDFVKAYKTLNQVFNATADNSFLGQQGAWAMTRDPKAAASILSMNRKAFTDPRALGKFLVEMTDKAEKTGTLTPAEMTSNGLRIGGKSTEFGIGQTVPEQLGESIKSKPVIGGIAKAVGNVAEASDRLMGFTGDAARVSLADLEVKNLVREKMGAEAYDSAVNSGDTSAIRSVVDELQQSGKLRDLFDEINAITGYSKETFGGKGAAGELAQLAMFAPRWFQARIQRELDGLVGLAKLPLGNASIKERYARKSLVNYVLAATALTVDINAAAGNETDFRPLNPDGTINPNFMAIRIGDRDFNLFGPEIAIARIFLRAAKGEPVEAVHGLTAGFTKDALDVVLGKDAGGRPVNLEDWKKHPENGARWFASHFSPIGAWDVGEEIGSGIRKTMKGDPSGATDAAVQVPLTAIGLNSAPLSYTDIAQRLTDKAYDEGKLQGSYNGRPKWDNLRRDDREMLQDDPALKEAKGRITPVPVSDPERLRIAFDNINSQGEMIESDFKKSLDGGATGKALRAKVQDFLRSRYEFRRGVFENPENKSALEEATKNRKVNPDDVWRDKYAAVPLEEDAATGELNFKKQKEEREAVLKEAEVAGADTKYVKTPSGKFNDPDVTKAVSDYRAAREIIQPYLEIRDNVMSKTPVLQKFFDEYMRSNDTDKAKLRKSPLWKAVDKQMDVVTQQRRAYLIKNPVVLKLLDKYGYQHPSLTPATSSRGKF
jgi:hypothetical protein